MATKQERLDALEEAIDSGATEVSYDGKTVKYRSLREMRRIRDELRTDLGLNGTKTRRTVGVVRRPR